MSLLLLLAALLPQEKLRIPDEEFARRRAALIERLGGAPLALDAGPIRGIDNGGAAGMYDFKYLTGFHETDAVLVIDAGKATVFVADSKKLKAPVTLERIKGEKSLTGIPLLRQSRLSVMPLEKDAFDRIVALGG